MSTGSPPPRTKAEILADARRFAVEDVGRTWRLLAGTVFALVSALLVAGLARPWPLRALGSVVAGLVLVRLFIFLHDIEHGAILRTSPLRSLVSRLIGLLTLVSPPVWREFHNAHHGTTALLLDDDLARHRGGDRVNRVVDVETWSRLAPGQRRAYRIVRHALIFVFAWITVFALGIGLGPLLRDPRRNADAALVLVLHFTGFATLVVLAGATNAFFLFALPVSVASTLGAYLFYAQHNFPDSRFLPQGSRWDSLHAALEGSSFFRMSPLMHWFTGNIGYHHVHHLDPRIPFYRLPEAMAAIPELHDPPSTSFAPRDVLACLSIHVWDPESERLVGFAEADRLAARSGAP
ncbi:MAG: fatty acid desaturase [Polyangiales bacterium]